MEYESDEHNETERKADPKKEMKEASQNLMTKKQLSDVGNLSFVMKKFDEMLRKMSSFHGNHVVFNDTSGIPNLKFCGTLKQFQISGTQNETLYLQHPKIAATIKANLPQITNKRILSLNIGCVATGRTHYRRHRKPRALFMVDTELITRAGYGIDVEKPIKSNLSEISGIEGMFDKLPKESLSTVIEELCESNLLSNDVILVGYGIEEMVKILGLIENKHYHSLIDIRTVIQPGMSFNICYSLDHYATALCHIEKLSNDPLTKCEVSMKIFKQFIYAILSNIVNQNRIAIEQLRDKLEKIEKKYSYIDEHNYCGSVCLKPNPYCQCSDEPHDSNNSFNSINSKNSKTSKKSNINNNNNSNNNDNDTNVTTEINNTNNDNDNNNNNKNNQNQTKSQTQTTESNKDNINKDNTNNNNNNNNKKNKNKNNKNNGESVTASGASTTNAVSNKE